MGKIKDEAKALLYGIADHSPFLTRSFEKDPEFLARALTQDAKTLARAVMDDTRAAFTPGMDDAALKSLLRRNRRKISTLAALADLSGAWALEDVTRALSDYAGLAVELALAHLLRGLDDRGFLSLPDADDCSVKSGVAVFAVGKLGAYELNYSSDIDLLVVFDETRAVSEEPGELRSRYVRLTRDLVRILEEPTADGIVFRTDLRLRPDPAATPLAVSLPAAEIYYGSLGQNWERAAMIKARPIAGDAQVADDFMKVIKAWVWRRSLDFAAIQDIHSIKRQINAHKVAAPANTENPWRGYNVKIGHGGIREIEFYAQTQQLIYGGRDPRLRESGTLAALQMLRETEHIGEEARAELDAAYRFLRNTEHRLQMIEDRQTHSLPDDAEGFAGFAAFMGYEDAAGLADDLAAHTDNVKKHYAALFVEAPDLSGPGDLVFTGTEDDPATIDTLTGMGFAEASRTAAQIRAWHHGRYRATRSDRARQILTELVPALLQSFAKTPHPDDAFIRFDRFLEAMPAGIPVFSLFQQNPELMQLVADIMGTAPRMAQRLGENPNLLEAVLTADFFGPLPGRDTLDEELRRILATARGYEDVLDLVRRWARDKRFHAGVHILKSITPAEDCGPFLSDVAELSINALLPHVIDEFAEKHGRFAGGGYAIVAMGRLGSRQLTTGSDLDLIAIYDAPDGAEASDGEKPLSPSQYHIRLTQRLIAAITAPTAEGKLYEIDLRLRPTGNAGPLAVALKGFEDYQHNEAWVWEHMSLIRARVVAGPDDLARKIMDVRRDVITLQRDPAGLAKEVDDMRRRMAREFGADDRWDMKNRRGGLTDIMFITQYLVLCHAHEHPEIIARDGAGALEKIAAAGLIDPGSKTDILHMRGIAKRVQSFLRLAAEQPFKPETAPEALKTALVRSVFPDSPDMDFDAFAAELDAAADKAYACYRAIVEAAAA